MLKTEMAKRIKLVVFLIVLAILMSLNGVAYGKASFNVSASNNLSVPFYGPVDFSVSIENVPASTQFALFEGNLQLPLEFLSRDGNTFRFRTIASFAASEKKSLTLDYGDDVSASSVSQLLCPSFLGNVFVGIGSGKLYIVPTEDNSEIKVTDSSASVIYSGTLNAGEEKTVSLKDNTVFKIESSKPVFAEVSSLQPNYVSNSSDDVSSVYGAYFRLFIPKEIFVSSVEATSLKIVNDEGKSIYDGKLSERGVYVNLNLNSGIYTISSEKPVLVQFGYSDDNIYTLSYGATSSLKLFSFGDIVVSSLYPDTLVTVKTVSGSKSLTLKTPGDFYQSNIISSFASSKTEYAPVYLTYSKPVIIYTDADFGNIGGEQIPSLEGDNKNFIFRTGKVYNFENVKRYRQVAVIAKDDGTEVEFNGTKFQLNALGLKTFSFYDSYSLVEIKSNKAISVFETGLGTDKEFLSMLVPLQSNNVISAVVTAGNSNQNSQGNSTSNPTNPSSTPKSNFFNDVINKVGSFFAGLWGTVTKGNWINDIKIAVTNSWNSAKPLFNNLSVRIIVFFLPLSNLLLPYLQKVLPSVTAEQLSAYIFFAILLILILLVIPKGRKKRKPIPTVSIGEVKKKSLDFNVKTLEEKQLSGSETTFEEQPITISRKAQKEEPSTIEAKKEEAGNLAPSVIEAPHKLELPKKEEAELKLPTLKKAQKKPLFGRKTEEPSKEAIEIPPAEVNIVKEPEAKETRGEVLEQKESIQAVEEKNAPETEVSETTASFADFGQPPEEALIKAKEEGILAPEEGGKVNIVKTEPAVETPAETKEESSFLNKLKETIAKEELGANAKPEQLEEQVPVKPEEKLQEETVGGEVREESEQPAPAPQAPEEPSTMDVLLKKIQSQTGKTPPSDLITVREERTEKAPETPKQERVVTQSNKRVVDRNFVAD
ncbi:MAG: hypothetical protein ACPLZB_00595, partial [Caldisericaceae bacterium]